MGQAKMSPTDGAALSPRGFFMFSCCAEKITSVKIGTREPVTPAQNRNGGHLQPIVCQTCLFLIDN